MTTRDERRLFDLMTRHQIYLEGVKDYESSQFDQTVRRLRREIRELFFDIEYDSLSGMTKREFDRFLKRVTKAHRRHFGVYTKQLIRDLELFSATDAKVQREMYEDAEPERGSKVAALLEKLGIAGLWAKIRREPMGSDGLTVEDQLEALSAASLGIFLTQLRRSRANRESMELSVRNLLGTQRRRFKDGAISRLINWGRGTVATVYQHTSSGVTSFAARAGFDRYQWASILDSRTSDICRSRHEKVYVFGDGPIPPAHPNCRSKIVPYIDENTNVDDTYYSWIKRQPAVVQNDILGRNKASRLRSGTITSKDLPKFNEVKPLTPQQFADKIGVILAT